jgi:Tfp pilus assembly PilM family ATPase
LVLAGIVDRLIPLQAWLFPSRVLLELDDHFVTLLALDHQGSIPTVKWLERVPLPAGTCDQGIPVRIEALADFIGDLLVERGFATARVVAVLPTLSSEWHLVQWPGADWPEDPRRLLIERGRQAGFRLPIQSADLRVIHLEPDDGAIAPSSLVIAVRKALLLGWIETFATAGLSLDGLEAGQVCVLRALEPLLNETPDGQVVAVFELSKDSSHLLLLQRGIPVYERRLAGSLAGIGVLADELRRSIDFWRQQERGVTSVQLVLHGSQAALSEEVVEPLRQRLPAWQLVVADPITLGWLQGPAEPLQAQVGSIPANVELLRLLGLALVETYR